MQGKRLEDRMDAMKREIMKGILTGTTILYLLYILMTGSGCATSSRFTKVESPPDTKIRQIYDNWTEYGFCLTAAGDIYNILYFSSNVSWCASPMCLCRPDDIVAHTHPIIGENGPSVWDWWVWERYARLYDNRFFGVFSDQLRVYRYDGAD